MIGNSKLAIARQQTLFPVDGTTDGTVCLAEFILADELRFLDALCIHSLSTMDDAVADLSAKFEDGGRWRGSIALRLAREGLIVPVGAANSRRTHRHRGLLRIWSVGNRPAVEARRAELRIRLAEYQSSRNETGSTMPVVEPVEATTPQTPGGN